MRLKMEGLNQGQKRGIHFDVNKKLLKKCLTIRTKVGGIVNALKNNGDRFILDDNDIASLLSRYKSLNDVYYVLQYDQQHIQVCCICGIEC